MVHFHVRRDYCRFLLSHIVTFIPSLLYLSLSLSRSSVSTSSIHYPTFSSYSPSMFPFFPPFLSLSLIVTSIPILRFHLLHSLFYFLLFLFLFSPHVGPTSFSSSFLIFSTECLLYSTQHLKFPDSTCVCLLLPTHEPHTQTDLHTPFLSRQRLYIRRVCALSLSLS